MEHFAKLHVSNFATITMVFIADSVEMVDGEWLVNFTIKKFPNKIWGNQQWSVERWNRVSKKWDFVADIKKETKS